MKKEEKTNKEVSDLKNQIETLTNNWKRAAADYQNLEKRCEKERKNFYDYAKADLILRLLVVLNNLEKSADHLKDKGLSLIVNEFKRILTSEGVVEIEALGKSFDPCLMEAVGVVDGGDKDKIAEVTQKGYFIKDRVLCPAKVKVYQGEEGKEKQGEQKEPSSVPMSIGTTAGKPDETKK